MRIRSLWLLLLAAGVLLIACPGTETPVESEEPTTSPPSEPTTAPVPEATPCAGPTPHAASLGVVTGAWTGTGPSWPIRLELGGDLTIVQRDLVSPCPLDVVCVWSGIVISQGTFVLDGTSLALTWTSPGDGPAEVVHPTTLEVVKSCEGTVGLVQAGDAAPISYSAVRTEATP